MSTGNLLGPYLTRPEEYVSKRRWRWWELYWSGWGGERGIG